MRKKVLIIILAFSLLSSFTWSQTIRKAVWAGQFYEGRAESLSNQIDNFLMQAKEKDFLPHEILALIVPHAGYSFSGHVAGHAYHQILGKNYETVIIIGPSHHYGFDGCSIYPRGGYETPLGIVQVDEPLASALSKISGFEYFPQAHQREHSVEVQIPFIQKILPQAKIVPIVMGIPTQKTISTLANALIKGTRGKKVLVVASTDMSHYLPRKKANEIDAETISLVESLKTSVLIRKLERRENIMCGGGPVASSLEYAQTSGDVKVSVLFYADSSQTGGPDSQVVGYFAAAVYLERPVHQSSLSTEEKKLLLQIARSAVETYVKERRLIDYQTQNANLLAKRGAFVTLKKQGSLRGCIGFIEPVFPLYQTVMQAAIYAAVRDERFSPVTLSELKDLEVEISVLSPLKKIHDTSFIIVGKHGLYISKGDKKGLLLPQVPVENHWSKDIFLQHACLKAGLPPDSWKSGADIFIFEAIVFE